MAKRQLRRQKVLGKGIKLYLDGLYDGDLARAKGEYNAVIEAVNRGLESRHSSDPLTERVERYLERRQVAEERGIPVLPIEMEPLSNPSPKQLKRGIEEVLSALSQEERQVLESLMLRGSTYVEMAERLGMPVEEVRRIQQRALDKMGLYARQMEPFPFEDFLKP